MVTGSYAMPAWLILLIIGVVLAIVGFGGVGDFLIWIGVAVLVVGAVLALVGRSRVRGDPPAP